MSTPESAPTRTQRARVSLFRVLGGTLLTFAVLGLTCLGVGIYYTLKESATSGWFPPILFGALAVAVGLMAVIGTRALRVKSGDELERQSTSKWIDL